MKKAGGVLLAVLAVVVLILVGSCFYSVRPNE